MVQGNEGFNSGQVTANNKFLHRFEKEGTYCVKSDGAANCHCLIRVLVKPAKTQIPKFKNQEPKVIHVNHKIYLQCDTKNSEIHYTTNGSLPNKLCLVKQKKG